MKSILFSFLNKMAGILARARIHRAFPGLVSVYDYFYQAFWPHQETIDVQGSKMYINIQEKNPALRRTFQAYAANKIHEKATTNLFKKIVKKGDVVLDLGANIGYFTLLGARLAGENGRVFSFEPEPKNYEYLVKNIGLNGYKTAQAFQKAVSDKNGKTELFICSYDTGHHTINQYEGIRAYSRGRPTEKQSIRIDTVALDDFLKNKAGRVDLVKIDVEGAELLAIKGMRGTLKANPNLKILLEFFPLLLKQMGSSPQELINILTAEEGFNIYAVGHDYAMENSLEDLLPLENFNEIMDLLKEESDHINLFLKR